MDWFLHRLGVKIASTAVGFVAFLIWMAVGGGGGPDLESVGSIPSRVWDGGAGTMVVEVELSEPGTLHASFWDEGDERWLDADQRLPAGSHRFEIDLPAGVLADFEVEVARPKEGSSVEWTFQAGGEVAWTERLEMDHAPEQGEVLRSAVEFEDAATGNLSEDW